MFIPWCVCPHQPIGCSHSWWGCPHLWWGCPHLWWECPHRLCECPHQILSWWWMFHFMMWMSTSAIRMYTSAMWMSLLSSMIMIGTSLGISRTKQQHLLARCSQIEKAKLCSRPLAGPRKWDELLVQVESYLHLINLLCSTLIYTVVSISYDLHFEDCKMQIYCLNSGTYSVQ